MDPCCSCSRRGRTTVAQWARKACTFITCAALVAGMIQYYVEADADQMITKHINEEIRKRLDVVLPKLIEQRLEIYDADKTGRPDFALEKSGGTIVAVRDAARLDKKYPKSSPRFMIQECMHPAECWAFGGAKASVIIRLREKIFIQGVTLEHIHVNQSFTGELSSAPKHFMILGMQKANDVGCPLGQFEYNIQGKTLQYFEIKINSTKPYEYIQFKVLSNHGNPEYTCIYRLRVHGRILNGAHLRIS